MAYYAFANPALAEKIDSRMSFFQEMNGPRDKERNESRKRVGLTIERV